MKALDETDPRRRMRTNEQFPLRIVIQAPSRGFGERYTTMMEWLDEHCGINGWSIAPVASSGICDDAIAIYVSNPTCALAFIARWCLQGDPPGLYEFRQNDPPP